MERTIADWREELAAAFRERARRLGPAAAFEVQRSTHPGAPPEWPTLTPVRPEALPVQASVDDPWTVYLSFGQRDVQNSQAPAWDGVPAAPFMEVWKEQGESLAVPLSFVDAAIEGRIAIRRWHWGGRPTGIKYDILLDEGGRLRTVFRSRDLPFVAPFARRRVHRYAPYR